MVSLTWERKQGNEEVGLILEIMGSSSKACRMRLAGVMVAADGSSGEDGQNGG